LTPASFSLGTSSLECRDHLASPESQQSHAAMYMPGQPLTQFLPKPSNWQQRRPDLTLTKSPQWSYSAARDLQAYPSPPMSNSPTSPSRSSQFPEERSSTTGFNGSSNSAPAAPTISTARSTMAAQVLPLPTAPPPPQLYPGQPGPVLDPRQEIQPRPILSSSGPVGPQYAGSFLPGPVGVGVPRSMLGGQPVQAHISAVTYAGPTSVGGASGARMPKTSRRAKAHVAKACQNCKKAHLSCDEARPCARCVASGKQVRLSTAGTKGRGSADGVTWG
jgi:Fungal Zn(2)-Cys(6) binuclear cluster domain